MNECIFCKIVSGVIPSAKVYEDSEFFAFMDINPVQAGHVLLIPKEHIDYVFDMPEELYSKMFLKAKELSVKLQKITHAAKIGLSIEGIAVRHAHIHLVPVNNVNDLDPCNAKKENFSNIIAEKMLRQA
jgi:histidine triad (HIT) family protein